MGTFANSLKINVALLSVVGAYPSKRVSKSKYYLYSFLLEMILMMPIIVSPVLKFIIQKETDLQKICENGFLLSCISVIPYKILQLVRKHEEVKATVNFYDEKPILHDEDDQTVKGVLQRIRLYSKIYIMYFEFCNVMLALKTIFDPERTVTLDLWLPYDYKKSDLLFVLTVIYLHTGLAFCALTNSIIDTLIAGLMMHSIVKMKILELKLQRLNKHDENNHKSLQTNNNTDHDLSPSATYERVSKCVADHVHIIEQVKLVEETYSMPAFTQTMGSILVICMTTYQLTYQSPLSMEFYSSLSFNGAVFIELYILCFTGTVLTEQSSTLTRAVYLGEWYNYDEKTKKSLMILMERAKRPLKISLMIIDLSLDTFMMIVRRAYSLLAVLRSVND